MCRFQSIENNILNNRNIRFSGFLGKCVAFTIFLWVNFSMFNVLRKKASKLVNRPMKNFLVNAARPIPELVSIWQYPVEQLR